MASPAKLRVQPGVPAGGQFREQDRPESDTVLLADDTDALETTALEPGDPALLEDTAGFKGEPEVWVEEDAHLYIARSAKFWANRYGVDREDLQQDVAVAYVTARANAAKAGLNGETYTALDNPAAYIHATARNIAASAASGHTRSESRKGSRRYREDTAKRTQELGRALTEREEDEIAAQISNSMPPGRRPTKGYHRVARVASRTVNLDPLDEIIPESYRPLSSESDDFPAGSAGAAATDAIYAGGRVNYAVAKNEAWDAIAEQRGAPLAARLSITEPAAAKARNVLRSHGGAIAVAAVWTGGEASKEQTAALFAPYGHLDDAGRAQVVSAMTAHKSYADELWDAAVTTATRRRAS